MATSQDGEIVRRWRSGETGPQIAAAIGRSKPTVYKALRRCGIEPAPRAEWPKHEDEILRRWHSGESGVDIAAAIGLSSGVVYRVLNRHGIEAAKATQNGRRPKADHRRKHTIAEEEEIVRRYDDGAYISEIARRFSCSTATVANVVKRHGRKVRSGVDLRRRWSKDENAEMLRLRQDGWSQRRIAERLGTTQEQISRQLRRLGEPQKYRALKRGGRAVTSGGYVTVRVEDGDDFAEAARQLGRPLESGETVHHLNGDKTDNRIENLQLRKGNHGNGTVYTCRDCGSHNVDARRL